MAFVASDLATVEQAIAKGELSVTFADRSVTYRSIDDLIKARDIISASLSTRKRQTYVIGQKGFGA
jgi:hypothetical protein